MNREDIQKLLGGYATGTLTPEEQQALFSAALEDQELFDALAREQALRDLLEDPGARAQLLAALDEKPEAWYTRWWRPAALALATAGVAVLAFVAIRQNTRPVHPESVQTMAEAKPPAPAPTVREVPQAAQQQAEKTKPAPVQLPPANGPRAKRQFQSPAPRAREDDAKAVLPQLPAAPEIRDLRGTGVAGGAPGGVVGGVIGGVPPSAGSPRPPPPAQKTETLAKDVAVAAEFADAGNQRARTIFFGAQTSAFLGRQSIDSAGNAVAQPAGVNEPKQQRKAEMRATTGSLAARAALPGAPALGIRYTLLRKAANGSFAEVAPQDLQSGDTVEIRFEANQDGFLSVVGPGSRAIAATNVSQRVPYTTVPVEPGTDSLTVRFSRIPLTGTVRPSANFVETPADAGDRATYIAVGNPLADPLVFLITLVRR
jgi:hypothetical protein